MANYLHLLIPASFSVHTQSVYLVFCVFSSVTGKHFISSLYYIQPFQGTGTREWRNGTDADKYFTDLMVASTKRYCSSAKLSCVALTSLFILSNTIKRLRPFATRAYKDSGTTSPPHPSLRQSLPPCATLPPPPSQVAIKPGSAAADCVWCSRPKQRASVRWIHL